MGGTVKGEAKAMFKQVVMDELLKPEYADQLSNRKLPIDVTKIKLRTSFSQHIVIETEK